jgi:hypothetical protein
VASYILSQKGFDEAAKMYADWLGSTEHYSSYKLQLQHLIKLADESDNSESLYTLLEQQHDDLPLFESERSASQMQVSSRHKLVFNSLISLYQKAGLKQKAAELQLDEDRKRQNTTPPPGSEERNRPTSMFGTTVQRVTDVTQGKAYSYAWQILPEYLTASRYRVYVKHAIPGESGAFSITVWLDSDKDGIPDSQLAASQLLMGKTNDLWSSWDFETDSKNVFVGIILKPPKSYFYQIGGFIEGYAGLSDRVFYSRKLGKVPISSTRPRYANIMIKPLEDN